MKEAIISMANWIIKKTNKQTKKTHTQKKKSHTLIFGFVIKQSKCNAYANICCKHFNQKRLVIEVNRMFIIADDKWYITTDDTWQILSQTVSLLRQTVAVFLDRCNSWCEQWISIDAQDNDRQLLVRGVNTFCWNLISIDNRQETLMNEVNRLLQHNMWWFVTQSCQRV